MNLLQFVPIKLTVFLVIGIVIGYFFNVGMRTSIFIAAIGLFMLYWLHFKSTKATGPGFGYATLISCIGLGLISVSSRSSFNYLNHDNIENIDKPQIWQLSIREELKSTTYYQRYLANADYVNSKSSSGLILCTLPLQSNEILTAGDKILVWGSTNGIEPPKNPYQFNYKKYMKNKGVFRQLKINRENYFKLKGRDFRLKDLAQRWRKNILFKLKQQPFGKDELAVIQAIILGYRHDVGANLSDQYKAAGAMHIMAISGLHIGVILVIVNFLLRPLNLFPKGRLIQLFISAIVLWSFALMAGFSVSIIRAASMFTFLAYAMYINRPGSTYNILALSIFFILLILDPLLLFHVGFQLSYAAVISIVWLYPKLMRLWSPKKVFVLRIWQLFSVSIAAQLGVLPLILFYFHQFPALFWISNLAIVPFLGLIIGSGLVVILLILIDWVPELIIRIYNQLISVMNEVVAWVADQEAFLLKEIYFDEVHLLLSIILIISFIILIENFRYRTIRNCLFLVICLQFWNSYTIVRSGNKSQVILLHTIGSTTILYQNGHILQVLTDQPEKDYYGLKDFKTAERIKNTSIHTLRNSYLINSKQWLILNDPSIGEEIVRKADIWVLSNSPKINLDRYLSLHRPEKVIADGNNYNSFVRRWQKSCMEYNIPFYSTSQSGYLKIGKP